MLLLHFDMKFSTILSCNVKRKVTTVVLVTASLAAFATLGEGGKNDHNQKLLSTQAQTYNYKSFSLKSGYNYRGSKIFSTMPACNNYITLNTVITYEKGNNTYILPLKKKIILNKISFKPAAARP